MSSIDCKVEIGLYTSGVVGERFTLNSSALGVIGSDKIAALTYFDVSEYARSVQIKRGRSRQLDYFNAGTASVTFTNISRVFDPINTDSAYYPEIKPRMAIRISSKNIVLFTGVVNDWDLEYDIAYNDTATATCSDAFTFLGDAQISAFTPLSQKSGARMVTILNRPEVRYTGATQISEGKYLMLTTAVPENTGCLNYLRQIERSELGYLYIDAEGVLVFKIYDELSPTAALQFTDSGSGIPFQTLSNEFGDELIYNTIYLTNVNKSVFSSKTDQESIALYGASALTYDDLLVALPTPIATLAQRLLDQYSQSQIRLTGFTVQMRALSDSQQNSVLALDLTDTVNVTKTFAVGTPSSFTQLSLITGVSHSITPDDHAVTFNVENATPLT